MISSDKNSFGLQIRFVGIVLGKQFHHENESKSDAANFFDGSKRNPIFLLAFDVSIIMDSNRCPLFRH